MVSGFLDGQNEDGQTEPILEAAERPVFGVYTEVGADGYPPEWHATIKHIVRTAAHHRCVRCGHPYRNGENGNGEWSPCDDLCTHEGPTRDWFLDDVEGVYLREAQWRILTVHHLDGDKTNCRWWNLASLCQRCHLTIQGRVVMARVWPWEHSDWFKPYVAGYYAHAYLGQDLTRAEVEARMEELLVLECSVFDTSRSAASKTDAPVSVGQPQEAPDA